MNQIPGATDWITKHLAEWYGPRADWTPEQVDHRDNLLGVLVLWELHREALGLPKSDAAPRVPTDGKEPGV